MVRRVLRWKLVVAALAVGCSGAPAEDDDTDVVHDSDTDNDTDRSVDTDGPDDTDPPLVAPVLVEEGVQTCARPAARGEQPFDRLDLPVQQGPITYLSGGGSAVGDFDGDGLLDVLAVASEEAVLFVARGETFERRQLVAVDPEIIWTGLFGAAAADYDADGDLDVMITGLRVPNHLLRNRGDGTFDDVTDAAGVRLEATHASASPAWHDVNGDEHLDLLISGHGVIPEGEPGPFDGLDEPHDTHLFLSNGDGTFTDAPSWFDADLHLGYTFVAAFFDADGDGDDDLYLANDFGTQYVPCQVALREGDRFVAGDNLLGLNAYMSCMGIGIGQLDASNARESIGLPAFGVNALMVYQRSGWFDSARAQAFVPDLTRLDGAQVVGWGAEMIDVDNDGDMDMPTAYGALQSLIGENPDRQQDALYLTTDAGVFEDFGAAWGVADGGSTRSMNVADLNRDGWPDFVSMSLDGYVAIYRSRCGAEAWLDVSLEQDGPNRAGIGATVRAVTGPQTRFGRLRAGGTGYGTSHPPVVHFGLETRARVDRLEVVWPDGEVTVVQDLPTRQRVTVRRPDRDLD